MSAVNISHVNQVKCCDLVLCQTNGFRLPYDGIAFQ